MKKTLSILIAISMNSAVAANAIGGEYSNCACVTDTVASSAAVGNILNANGDVLYTAATGYAKAKAGARLAPGSQVSVGDKASARISVGSSCKLSVPANSIASVLQPKGANGKICVKIASLLDPATGAVQEGSSTQNGLTGNEKLLLAAFTAAAVGGALASTGGDTPSSP